MSHTKSLFTLSGAGQPVPATAEEIMASARAQLSRRVRPGSALSSPQATRDFLALRLGAREFESFCCMFLDLCGASIYVQRGCQPGSGIAFVWLLQHITFRRY
jgi:DNA repair protein RadC